jgi:hypothetical protein
MPARTGDKKEDVMSTSSIEVPEEAPLVGVGGWLALLIFGLAISGVQGIMRHGIDAVFGIGNLWLAYALYRYMPYALLQAKLWLSIRLLSTLLPGVLLFIAANTEPPEQAYKFEQAINGGAAFGLMILSIPYAIWLLYLFKSKRVNNTYLT